MRKTARKLSILLLCAVLFLSGCAQTRVSDQQFDPAAHLPVAEDDTPPPPAEPVTELHLAYIAGDSLNPHKMTTQINSELIPLLYDSLVRLDLSYQPQCDLASEITMNGVTCIVTLKPGAQFTDGTLLSAADVLYSLQVARTTDSNWASTLGNVSSASMGENGEVIITLSQADQNFPALLTFPIIKENSLDANYPTGISKFYVAGTWEGGIRLIANPIYYGEKSTIETVYLLGIADSQSVPFHLSSAEIDLMYNEPGETPLNQMNVSSKSLITNRFVYLGVNARKSLLGDARFRQAISLALNRDELVSRAYVTRATASMYPINPAFFQMAEIEVSAPRQLSEAEKLLQAVGLKEKNEDGYYLYKKEPLELRLLVNTENSYRNAAATLIADQLSQIGIKVTITSEPMAQYRALLGYYDYDLYLGEIRLPENMDFSSLLPGGSLAYNTPYSETLASALYTYRHTGEGIAAVCEAFSQQSPFIPLLFCQGTISQSREFRAEIVATEHNIFYNIMEW